MIACRTAGHPDRPVPEAVSRAHGATGGYWPDPAGRRDPAPMRVWPRPAQESAGSARVSLARHLLQIEQSAMGWSAVAQLEGGQREGWDADVLQFLRPAEFGQVDDRGSFMDAGAHASYQLGGGEEGATGGDQVIEQQYRVAFTQAVGMNFQVRFAILGAIGLRKHVGGQFALLAEQHQRLVQLICEDRADQKTAGVESADMSEVGFNVALDKTVSHHAQRFRRLEQRGDIAKDHARLRKIRNRADQGLDAE